MYVNQWINPTQQRKFRQPWSDKALAGSLTTGIPDCQSICHSLIIFIFFLSLLSALACRHYAQNFIFIEQLGADVSPDFHHQETTGHQSCFPSPRQPRRPAGWVKHNTNTTQTHKRILFVSKRSSLFYLFVYFSSKGPCPCGIGAGSDEQSQHEELLQSCHYCGQARTIASKHLFFIKILCMSIVQNIWNCSCFSSVRVSTNIDTFMRNRNWEIL